MSAPPPPDLPVVSPAKTRALFLGALAAALLGLTLLDVAPSARPARHGAADPQSLDCIVASAIFVGVEASLSLP
jgi:hypothetical protein